jgi:hypothetical protein
MPLPGRKDDKYFVMPILRNYLIFPHPVVAEFNNIVVN